MTTIPALTAPTTDPDLDHVLHEYVGDPRITPIEHGVVYAVAHPEASDSDEPWTLRLIAGQIIVRDCAGDIVGDACTTAGFVEALCAVLGEPLAEAEDALIAAAADDTPFCQIDGSLIDTPTRGQACDGLIRTGILEPDPVSGGLYYYTLTDAGRQLAADIDDFTDDQVRYFFNTRRTVLAAELAAA